MLGTMALGSAYLGQYYGGGAAPAPPEDMDALTAVISGGARLSAVISGGQVLSAVISGGQRLGARITSLPGE